MNLRWTTRVLHPRHVFRISRASRREVRNVFVRIEADGVVGWGEASPNAFYGETCEQVEQRLLAARDWVSRLEISSTQDIEAAWRDGWRWLAPSRAAQCAVDVALWDWFARRRCKTVSELLWDDPPRPVRTFCTIGISDRDEFDEKLGEVRDFPRIKLKADANCGMDAVRRCRERSPAELAVDANCAWTRHDVETLLPQLAAAGVCFLEQPLPPGAETDLPRERVIPVFADESCVTEDDVDRVAEHFDGFNIKLVKCGGITPARRMVLRGAALGRGTMVGCMLESSLLISAGLAVAQRTTYADLDGAWLLADDPCEGWEFRCGVLHPPDSAGLGCRPTGVLADRG